MKRLFGTIAIAFAASSGYTQDEGERKIENDSTYSPLSEVIITTIRHGAKSVDVPFSISTVSKQYVDDFGPRSTPDVLQDVNGVFIQKTNHGGGSPFVRGLTGNQTLTLVDGIRLNNATFRYGPNQYLNTIDPFTIRRIEVAKGTGSVQYGTDAIGGVVHILTRDPEFSTGKAAWHGKLMGRYMTGDMEKTLRGETSYSGNKFAFNAGISKRRFGDIIGGDTTGKQSPSGYGEWAFDAKGKVLLQQNVQLTLATQFLRQSDVPVFHKVQLENFAFNVMDPQQRLLNYARLNIAGKKKWMQEVEIIASWQQSIEGRRSRKNGNFAEIREKDKINTLGFTADIFSSIARYWTANSGIELYNDKVNSTRNDFNTQTLEVANKRGLYPDGARYGNYSVYSLHHFNFDRWKIDAGLRFNTFDIRLSDTTLGKVKISPSALVANVALMYKITDNQTVYTTYSSGYRAPNIDDMGTLGIVDFRYEVPAKGLEPEKSRNTELGYKLQTGKVAACVAAYYMHLSNIITRAKTEEQINGYVVYQKKNTQSSFIRGFETELYWFATRQLDFKGGIAYAYGQNLSANEPMRRVPPFNGRLLGKYKAARWFAAVEFRFASAQKRLAQGDKDDNRIGPAGTAAWELFNVYGGYKFSWLHFNAGMQNIFNEDYRMHGSGINGVGRSAWMGVSVVL